MLVALAAVGGVAIGFTGVASASTDVFHGLRVKGSARATSTSPLVYQGGAVETTPVVYIDYWGSQWASGFSTGGYSSAQAQNYTNGFFGNVGGSSWDNIDTQYCQGVATGSTSCATATAGNTITNPTGQLAGTYVHNTSLPGRITQSAIANEAV